MKAPAKVMRMEHKGNKKLMKDIKRVGGRRLEEDLVKASSKLSHGRQVA